MWDQIALGSLGAVVLADTRRLADCFPAVDYFERREIPFIVAVNCFEGARRIALEEVQTALNLGDNTLVLLCDARDRASCKNVLISLVQHAMESRQERPSSIGDFPAATLTGRPDAARAADHRTPGLDSHKGSR
jgi:signal recognition particle receptor subunit beta